MFVTTILPSVMLCVIDFKVNIMDEDVCRQIMAAAGIPINAREHVTFKEEDAPGKSYLSILQRFTLENELDVNWMVRVILKSNPDKEHSPDSLFDKLFASELKMYAKVLPIFKDFYNDTRNSITWPELYCFTKTNQIVMEDLKPNFCNNTDSAGLSLEEALLAVKSLGMFHGASIAAKAKGKLDDGVMEPYFYCRSDENINSFLKNGIKILVTSMRQSWGVEWLELANKLDDMGKNVGENLLKLHSETDSRFKVVNHGDCWKANFMYQYDENRIPISFRFIDFQLSHYGSFSWDLSYFFFINVNLDLKYKHYDEIILSYHETLKEFLDSCGCGTSCPTLEQIYTEMDRFLIYGFLKCCTDLPYQICPLESGIDAENLFIDNEETEKLKIKLFSYEKYITIVRVHMEDLKRRNVL